MASPVFDLSLLSGDQRDSFKALESLMKSYSLQSLTSILWGYVIEGYSPETISVIVQDTPEWKQRFAANETRQAKGMPVLSPQEYLATESAYRQILHASGLPEGFYDQQSDFVNWIAADVSPSEIQDRVELAVRKSIQADGYTQQVLFDFYGVSQQDLVAYFLDEKRALPLLQKKAEAVAIGAEAARRGLNISSIRAEELFSKGITQEKAAAGFAAVDEILDPTRRLAALAREGYTQFEAEKEAFGEDAEAGRKRRRLLGQELARFGAATGVASTGLRKETAGQF